MAILWEHVKERKRRPARPVPTKRRPTTTGRRRTKVTKARPPRTIQTVEQVVDGDTVLTQGGEYVRLARVQSPPIQTAGGLAAKCWLSAYCPPGATISFERSRCDERGRTIAEVFLLTKNLSDLMLKQGVVSRLKKPVPA